MRKIELNKQAFTDPATGSVLQYDTWLGGRDASLQYTFDFRQSPDSPVQHFRVEVVDYTAVEAASYRRNHKDPKHEMSFLERLEFADEYLDEHGAYLTVVEFDSFIKTERPNGARIGERSHTIDWSKYEPEEISLIAETFCRLYFECYSKRPDGDAAGPYYDDKMQFRPTGFPGEHTVYLTAPTFM